MRAELVTGANQAGAVQITKHVIDHEDIRNIYVAGEAVKRGLGGLDIVNFESNGVQEQKRLSPLPATLRMVTNLVSRSTNCLRYES